MKVLVKTLLAVTLVNSSGFCASKWVSLYEPLSIAAPRRAPLAFLKTDPLGGSVRSFSSSSLRRVVDVPFSLSSFSTPRRFVSAGPCFLSPSSSPLMDQRRYVSHKKALHKTEEGFAKATTDTAFKHMLSPNEQDNKDLLISFLNTFVPTFRSNRIQRIEAMPTPIPVLPNAGQKQTFMDLRVQSERGDQYIVEMQARRHAMFDERALYYAAAVYSRQLSEQRLQYKDWYLWLKPVIALQVLDYDTNKVTGIKSNLPEGRETEKKLCGSS